MKRRKAGSGKGGKTGKGSPFGKTRRFPIPGTQPHRDRKNDYRRTPKHRAKDVP